MTVKFEKLDKALDQLEKSIGVSNPNDLERDGIIQRFEYTIELLWKISKRVLEENGITALTPKDIIREMARIDWIENPETFIDFIKVRNETSHSYNEDMAHKAYEAAKKFAIECRTLIEILKQKII